MKIHSVKFNFGMRLITTITGVLFPLLTFPYVAHVLSSDVVGDVSFAASLVGYFALFSQMGIPAYGQRLCAQVRDNKAELSQAVHELLRLNLILCVIAYGALLACVLMVPRLLEERLFIAIVSSTILLNALGMEYLYAGLEQYVYITVRGLVFKVLAIVFLFVAVHSNADAAAYALYTVLVGAGANIVNFIHARKYVSFKPREKLHLSRHLKPMLVFFALSVTATIYTNLDTVMLGFLSTSSELGLYFVATKFKIVLLSLSSSLVSVLLPRASYYSKHGETEKWKRLSRQAFRFTAIATVALSVYFIAFAPESIAVIANESYYGAIPAMQAIMPTVFLIGMTGIIGWQILAPAGKEKLVVASTAVGAVVDLILNFMLMPTYGALGAAIGTLAAEVSVLAVQLVFCARLGVRTLSEVSFWRLGLAILAALPASFTAAALVQSDLLRLLVSAPVFFGVYLAVLIVLREPLVVDVVQQVWKACRLRISSR